jgi:multidrug efflux pump subunit AcrA (membrane-fusion protein)
MIVGMGYAGGWIYTTFSPNVRLKQTVQQLDQTRHELQQAQTQLASQAIVRQQLEADLRVRQRQIDELNMSLSLLKVDKRVAEITVVRQQQDEQGGLLTEFTFQEVDADGQPLDVPRTFQISGDLLYVDFWIIKFDDRFVEMADLDRGSAICLFRRLFGEHQEPHDGFTLDPVGVRPLAYGRRGASEFERQLWHDFWNIANDRARAAELGIRAAHGEAVATRLKLGQSYRVLLRASDGLSISPSGPVPPAIAEQPRDLS